MGMRWHKSLVGPPRDRGGSLLASIEPVHRRVELVLVGAGDVSTRRRNIAGAWHGSGAPQPMMLKPSRCTRGELQPKPVPTPTRLRIASVQTLHG